MGDCYIIHTFSLISVVSLPQTTVKPLLEFSPTNKLAEFFKLEITPTLATKISTEYLVLLTKKEVQLLSIK